MAERLAIWSEKEADTIGMKPSKAVFERVRQCLESALALDREEVEQIQWNTTAADVDKWDSLSHLNLILELERCFGIALDDEQVVQLASVERILRVVENNGR